MNCKNLKSVFFGALAIALALSAAPNGRYQSMSGTSMATPHVAGLLGLIYQVMPHITIDDAAKIITSASKDLGDSGNDPVFGAGRVDAYRSVQAAQSFRMRRGR